MKLGYACKLFLKMVINTLIISKLMAKIPIFFKNRFIKTISNIYDKTYIDQGPIPIVNIFSNIWQMYVYPLGTYICVMQKIPGFLNPTVRAYIFLAFCFQNGKPISLKEH